MPIWMNNTGIPTISFSIEFTDEFRESDTVQYIRSSRLTVFTILQTMLIIAFTADSLLITVYTKSQSEKMAQKLIHSIFLVDIIILCVFATQIVFSATDSKDGQIHYECFRTDLELVTKVITTIWVSIGIAFARLTLVEIFASCGLEVQTATCITETGKMYIFTKALIYYTFLSVLLFIIPVLAQPLPAITLCVPTANTDHKYISTFGMIIAIGFYGIVATKSSMEERSNTEPQNIHQPYDKILCHLRCLLPYLSITFLTLFPFLLLNLRSGKVSFYIYKIFVFYVALSVSNISINRIYHHWSKRQLKKYQYFIV